MNVESRIVEEAAHRVEAEPGTGEAAWFAARQPGIVRYLEARCAGRRHTVRDPLAVAADADDDGLGLALLAALTIHLAYEKTLGTQPPRVPSAALERAERAVIAETDAGAGVSRQAALCEWAAGVIAAPPMPLEEEVSTRVGLALLAVIYALDEACTGRTVEAGADDSRPARV